MFLDSLHVELITVSNILHVQLIHFSPRAHAIDFHCWRFRSSTKYHSLGL